MKSFKGPSTYAEWLDCFDAIKEGSNDFDNLECIKNGNFVLSPGVAGRFATRVNDLVQYRIKKSCDKFYRRLNMSGSDTNMLICELLSLRKEFKFLIRFSQLLVLPEDHKTTLLDAIKLQANTIQSSLELSSAKIDKSGVISSVIRNNRINNLEDF